ncbi:MAG: hypothetical protein DLM58_06660 [Pseudonocardiales bacterium]|nr:MAG: hypothetical protein DLM58_06660 [Pseudonocardiales bacterium]
MRIASDERWLAIEDAGRVRDALGAALPVGVPEAFTEPVRDPMGDLVGRYARTHGPFQAQDVATRLGLGVAVIGAALARLTATGRVLQGEFRPGGIGLEWCDAEALRTIRRRSLAALRREVEPVPADALARFIPSWQGVGARATRGVDGLLRVVEQLAGVPLPASALESLILPSRVADYSCALLDELTLSGEVLWTGAGALAGNDGWVVLAPAELAPLVMRPDDPDSAGTADDVDGALERSIRAALTGDQALFYRGLADRVAATHGVASDDEISAAVWALVWGGTLTNDTLAPVRALLGSGSRTAHARRPRAPRSRYGRYSGLAAPGGSPPVRPSPPAMGGRWSATPPRESDPTRRALAAADVLLDRYGLVTRGSVAGERVQGGFAAVYPVLKSAEESGRARRGYFVDGLGAAQFALPGAVDRLRAEARPADLREPSPTLVLAATDPANPYGAALAWPAAPPAEGARRGHQPARKAGALVVLVDGGCVIYVERGGRTLLSFTDDVTGLQPAADALALAVRDGALGKLQVERADGAPIVSSPLGDALEAAGFRPTPRGLRLRA